MNAEILSKLRPQTVLPSKETKVSGLVPEHGPQEIALAAACADRAGFEVLVSKYVQARAGGADYQTRLAAWGVAIRLAIERKWPDGPKGKHWYRNLADLALREIIDPMHCDACNGTAIAHARPCRKCDASGKRTVTGQERARSASIPLDEWVRQWGAIYEDIYRKLESLERIAVGTMRYQLESA